MIDINKILPEQIKTDMPEFNPGDHIRVQVRVIEGDKERLQS
jgi:large subunit ribosomal protein L19